ncbi:thioredoxin fold domain-containing protein, partial [bacterium]|nr:thioredoxin fold domain-containing protein [bacterium]
FDSVTPETGWWAKTRKGLGLCTLTAGLIILLIGFSLHFDLPSLLPVQDALQTAETVRVTPTDQTRGTGSAESVSAPREIEFTVVQSGPGAQDFLTAKRAEAKAAGKPMLIDFWASWCVYCKKLDKLVWHDPAVAAEAARFVTIKVDATAPDDDEMTAIKEELKVPGLPRVVFIDSRGKILDGLSTGFQEADKMLDTLQKVR